MEIQEYINQRFEIDDIFLTFIERESSGDDSFQKIIDISNNIKIKEDRGRMKDLINFLSIITQNHHRNAQFFSKIERIFQFFKDSIQQFFSNEELFNIFKKNKRILLFLFNEKIINFDNWIFNYIYSRRNDLQFKHFFYYFYPEMKVFISKEEELKEIEEELTKNNSNILTNFEEKRLEGENDSLVSSLIRKDSVEEFISYVSRTNFSLTNKIDRSIFETNIFLLKNESTIIEYATFFGSIQIFKYLLLNNVELTSSLWIYAIHSQNAELIHLLELNHAKIEDDLYDKCLKESIKCHHNDIANYIKTNYINEEVDDDNFENKFGRNTFDYGFHYHNFSFFPNDFIDNKFIIFYLCKYGYLSIVELLINIKKDLDLTETII